MFLKLKYFSDKMKDILITDILYLFPSLCRWFIHRRIKRDISRFQLNHPSDKKSSLYQHGKIDLKKKNTQPILILHGLYSHPFIMLHLAEIAQNEGFGPIFSLYVSYNEHNLEDHRSYIGKALDHIEKMTSTNLQDASKGIILVGHSMGAIESANRALVVNDKRILAVISIAGRLNAADPCSDLLKDSLNQIDESFLTLPKFPLYQIVGDRDWNASLRSTIINRREGYYHIIKDAMHFNILFHLELKSKFLENLKSIREIDSKQ